MELIYNRLAVILKPCPSEEMKAWTVLKDVGNA
jgi:hypothetical protein